jgi:hypothetical protein
LIEEATMGDHKATSRERRKPNSQRQASRRFLIVCEGQTEAAYLRQLNRILRGIISIDPVIDHSSPQSVVNRAILLKNGDRRFGIAAAEADTEVWAVFDWDQHSEQVQAACLDAKWNGVKVVLSNPCIEVWLHWHYAEYMRLGCDQHRAQADLKKTRPEYVKGRRTPEVPLSGIREAVNRARLAEQKHQAEGRSFPEDRPSSSMYILIDALTKAWADARPDDHCPLWPNP